PPRPYAQRLRRRRRPRPDRGDGKLPERGWLDRHSQCAQALYGRHHERRRPQVRILITNDDGVDAPGIEVMRAIALALSDDVWVVAPDGNQSGAGHRFT